MKPRYAYILLVLFSNGANAQILDIEGGKGVKKFEIPFEFENDFIIVKAEFNSLPLKFIFDTGAEHTVLTKKEITDLLRIDYKRKFPILGADMTTELFAYLAQGVRIKINALNATNRNVLVLENDYFKFEEFAGISVQGILGADFFKRFIVHINYQQKIITLHDPHYFVPPTKRYEVVDIEITRNKPYIYINTLLDNGALVNTKYLIDTGGGLSLLVYTHTDPRLELPSKVIRSNIGMGLGGYLQGFLGRIPMVEIGPYKIQNIIANFQELPSQVDSNYLNDRNGILGNQILSRFDVIIDYYHGKIYLQPNRTFKDKFEYDRSGLAVIASGLNLNDFIVTDVIPGSPAYQAGVLKGDEIKALNGTPTIFFTLESMVAKFHKKAGKKITLRVNRNGKKNKITFHLRDLI